MVIVVDDEGRENEGDLTIAAEKVTPQAINFMAQYGRGLICLAMTPEHLDALEIPLMVAHNSSRFETAFCVSIEARDVRPREFRLPIAHPPCSQQLSRRQGLRI
jgi:3,4-dihydroxy 2-butanone 4-phosphate synthase / GTP cyclohydrolase II